MKVKSPTTGNSKVSKPSVTKTSIKSRSPSVTSPKSSNIKSVKTPSVSNSKTSNLKVSKVAPKNFNKNPSVQSPKSPLVKPKTSEIKTQPKAPKVSKIQKYNKIDVKSISRPMKSNPKIRTIPEKQKTKLRNTAVRNAWKEENNLVKVGLKSRPWTEPQRSELIRTGKVKGIQGHHIRSVNGHTKKWAADSRNIALFNKGEHLLAHGNNYRNPTTGKLIDRQKMINMNKRNVMSKKIS